MTDQLVLRYNVRWVEKTFPSRIATETLLNPEHQSGIITTNDYQAATQFLPGFHRHYRALGGLLGIPLTYALRRPHWSNARTYLFLTTASFGGFVIGHIMSLSAHYNFVRSIENPEGFSQALENIQHKTGSLAPPGPIIVRQAGKWAVDHDPDTHPLDTTSPVTHDSSTATSAPDCTPASIKPISKWDQIRAVNAPTASNSSWDAIRQKHERARLPSSSSSGNDMFTKTPGIDRAVEQAKFDDLLERERNMK